MEPISSSFQRISLRDIAKKIGVSHAAVSMALRDHPRISAAMREKIQAAAREMGYRPDPMLTALSHYRKGKGNVPVHSAIAWVNCWPNPRRLREHREFELYWRGAADAADKFGYRLEEFIVGPAVPPRRLEKVLLSRGIKGILLPPGSGHSDLNDWSNFNWEHFSVIRFGRSWTFPNAHIVTSDQVGNTMLAFENIWQRGYRRIGFVTGRSTQPQPLFKGGYFLAQAESLAGLRLPLLALDITDLEKALKELAGWIKKHHPDAILSDIAALRDMLTRIGYRVPEDIGLVAESVLDGNADAGIYQNPEEIGRVAFLAVMSLINDNAKGIPGIFRQVLVSGKWVDGLTLPRIVPAAKGEYARR